MTHLRKMMLDELERRNFTDSTRRAYFRIIEDFARHFNRPPDQLGPAHIREYTADLFRDRKLDSVSLTIDTGGNAASARSCFSYSRVRRDLNVPEQRAA